MRERSRPSFVCVAALLVAACSSKSAAPNADAGNAGAGNADANVPFACPSIRLPPDANDHCVGPDGGSIDVPIIPLACAGDGGTLSDAGDPDAAASSDADSGAQAALEADDAECKYHVVLQPECASFAPEITFRASVTRRIDGLPAAGAKPWMEALQGTTHPAPNTNFDSPEVEPGTYRIGPVHFDRAGHWNLTLHLFETCPQIAASPHGHADYSVDIP